MNIQQLRTELEYDEGCVYEIYKDHLGYLTFGIGHLITPKDVEFEMNEGTAVSIERVTEVFESDIQNVLSDCKSVFADLNDLPEEAQLIIANMMFNLGLTRFCKFKNMIKAINDKKWEKAASEMKDSLWYAQVTNRAERLIKRMEQIK